MSNHTPRNSFTSRTLPSRDVSDDKTLSECYADFILYCNPAIPLATDTIDLKTLFRTPPKSDGKSFSIFTLYQLICKLELKEIKTWAELALELGVEPPDPAKGQSPQKVQQYAVRLKRWMHAMHVDAFFEYLRGQSHVYWSQTPTQNDLVPEERDGVPNEEDLALRALLPETRPKRGRKRAEEKEDPGGETSNVARRRRVDSHTVPEPARDSWSAESPDDARAEVFDARSVLEARLEAWAASDLPVTGDVHHQHRASEPQVSMTTSEFHADRRLTHPLYRHPASKSPTLDPFSTSMGESMDSTETASRPRRKTGTVVSSAWRSSSATEGTKLRGRPPNNRNSSDGPYTTFPAIPELRSSATAPSIESPAMSSNAPTPRPDLWSSAVGNWGNTKIAAGGNGPLSHKLRLPLPIPDRAVGNGSPHYQQITPPPLTRNTPSPIEYTPSVNFGPTQWTPRPTMDTTRHASIPTSYYNADGSVTGESPVTNSSSAPSSRPQIGTQDRTHMDAIEINYMQTLMAAEWFDEETNTVVEPNADTAIQLVKAMIRSLRERADDNNSFLVNVATMAGGRLLHKRMKLFRRGENETAMFYRSEWNLQYGATKGCIRMQMEIQKPDVEHRRGSVKDENQRYEDMDGRNGDCGKVDWKQKYVDLLQQNEKLPGLVKDGQ